MTTNSTTDHAAELRSAIEQTRLVFEGYAHAEQALDYLELVLAANIARSCVATMNETMLVLGAGQLGAPNQPQRGMDAGAAPATLGPTVIGTLVVEVDTSQVDAALAKIDLLRTGTTVEKISTALCALASNGASPSQLLATGSGLAAAIKALTPDPSDPLSA